MKKENAGSTEAIGEKGYRRENAQAYAVTLLVDLRMCAMAGESVCLHRKNPKLEWPQAHLLMTTKRPKQLRGGGSLNETSFTFVNRSGSKRILFCSSEALWLNLEHWTKAAPLSFCD